MKLPIGSQLVGVTTGNNGDFGTLGGSRLSRDIFIAYIFLSMRKRLSKVDLHGKSAASQSH